MKRMLLIGAGFIAVASLLGATVTPASAAASPAVRKACEKQADLARPALRADEREAFIANCLANNTPTPRKKY
jgi:hypothetical protein